MRYRVYGIDEDNGETVELTVEAESIGHAEERAAMRGFTAQRVELLDESSQAPVAQIQQERVRELTPPAPEPAPAPVSDAAPAATADGVFAADEPPTSTLDSGMGKESESDVWAGGPSQWVNIKRFAQSFAITALLATGAYFLGTMFGDQTQQVRLIAMPLAFVPGLVMFGWAFAHTRATSFALSSERIRCREGIFTRRIEEIELYRVKDLEVTQTMAQRLARLGTVVLVTDDATCPRFVMSSIPHYESVRDRVRALVEKRRVERRFEVIGGGEGGSL